MAQIHGLEAKKQEVVKAAIAAEMWEYGFTGSCDKGFAGYAKATQVNPDPPRVWVSWPQATVHHELDHGREKDDLEPVAPAAEIFAKWPEEIGRVFKRYEEVPGPADFQTNVATLKHIALGLRLDPLLPQGHGSDKRPPPPVNTDLGYLVDQLVARTDDEYDGLTMKALHAVLYRLRHVIAHHQYLAEVLHSAVLGEQKIWDHLPHDVWETAEQARGAFAQLTRASDPLTPKKIIHIIKSISEALAAIPEARPIMQGIAAATSIVNDWMPDYEAPAPVKLQGSTAEQVLSNLKAALDAIDDAVYHQEWALAGCAQRAIAHVDNSTEYKLQSPTAFLAEDDADDLFKGEELRVRTTNLREVAGLAVRAAGVLDYIRSDLQTTLGSGRWERDPAIGLGKWGPFGHYTAFEYLHDDLTVVLKRLSGDLGEIAEQSVRVSYDFEGTEGQIEEELRRRADQVVDATKGWVPYGY